MKLFTFIKEWVNASLYYKNYTRENEIIDNFVTLS